MKKGAVFDMDGLLVDSERLYQKLWNELARERGCELGPEFVLEIAGTNGLLRESIVNRHFHTTEGWAIVEECQKRGWAALQKEVPLRPGVKELLAFFRSRGVRMAIASSNHIDQIRSNTRLSGIDPYFDAFVSGNEVEHGKPAPDIFLRAAGKLGLSPGDCYVFEDSLNGIRAAYAAGCAPVMIPDMIPPTEEIRPLCAGIFDDLNQAKAAFCEEEAAAVKA